LSSYSAAAVPHLPSFPTRRSSDLDRRRSPLRSAGRASFHVVGLSLPAVFRAKLRMAPGSCLRGNAAARRPPEPFDREGNAGLGRSEEHTSELQSREKLVCRLLLEK